MAINELQSTVCYPHFANFTENIPKKCITSDIILMARK